MLSERHRQSKAQAKSDSRLGQENLQPITWEAEQEDPYNLFGLLLNGRRINFFDTASGMTPLHHAVLAGHELPTWHLLAAGAKADVKDKRHGLAPPELAQREGNLDVAALFLRNSSESSGQGFVWQRKSYQVGRGMWSKHLSGTELQRAYRKAKHLRKCMRKSSNWLGPGMQVWYDYLGYEPTARDKINLGPLEDSDKSEYKDSD